MITHSNVCQTQKILALHTFAKIPKFLKFVDVKKRKMEIHSKREIKKIENRQKKNKKTNNQLH